MLNSVFYFTFPLKINSLPKKTEHKTIKQLQRQLRDSLLFNAWVFNWFRNIQCGLKSNSTIFIYGFENFADSYDLNKE